MVAAKAAHLAKPVKLQRCIQPVPVFLSNHIHVGDIIEIEMENLNPRELFLCEILGINERGIRAKSYDRLLRNVHETDFQYRDITKMSFLDGYCKAAKVALRQRGADASVLTSPAVASS